MNKKHTVALLSIALATFRVGAQTAKPGDYIENQDYNLTDIAAPRRWQYRPEGQDFVCVNGENRYTRALYGSHDRDRLETSDRPVFVAYAKNDSRNISFTLTTDGKTVSLEKTDYCEARYTAGRRTYTLRDGSWENATLEISVLAFPDRRGGIWRFTAKGFEGKVKITCSMCDIANQKLKRWGDMGGELPGSLEASPDRKNLQQLSWYAENATSYLTFDNLALNTGSFAAEYDKAEAYREELANRVVFTTPDPYINTLGGVLTTSGDGAWDGDTFLHGAIAWRSQLPGWRGAYMGDFLGWDDRAVSHFNAYAESQVRDVPCTIGHPAQDSVMNLCRVARKWGTPMYSNGYICRTPHRNDQMHHYDMNLCYIDELLWHFSFDADRDYLRKMWPVLKSHLAWEKLNYDPDDDGLYDAYCCIWASDGLYYNSGGAAHSTAYNYRGNAMAARIAEIIGEDPTPYRDEAAKILAAMNSRLWMSDKGCWAEYTDFMGLKRKHESAALWTVYTPIDSRACTPEQAFAATRYVDTNIPHIPIRIEGEEGSGFYTLSTTDWMPYVWSTNNVAHAEVMHTALAFFHAGRNDEAFRLMKGDLLDEMYLGASPGNMGQISHYDAARGETYRDFADNVGITARTAVQGLFGVTPDALNGKCYIRPGFPSGWDSASIKTPYIEYTFRRDGNKDVYDITQNFRQPLQVIIRQNTGNGRFRETALTNEKHQRVEIVRAEKTEELPVIAVHNPQQKDFGTSFDDVRTADCRVVKIDKWLNSCVADIFRNEYLSPSSPYSTLRIPKNGYGEWCHPMARAIANDSVFRSMVSHGVYTAKTDDGKVIPFRSFAQGRNVAFTSLWDNYPDSVTVPLRGRASHAYLLLAGTTNQMQSRIANGVVRVEYADGSVETLELVNPDNWCPIEQDYYVDGFAFRVGCKRPYRVHFMSAAVSRDLGKVLGIGGVYGREIEGGAAEILDMKLDPKKKLRSLTLRTLSNDVVIGVMGITLQG